MTLNLLTNHILYKSKIIFFPSSTPGSLKLSPELNAINAFGAGPAKIITLIEMYSQRPLSAIFLR